MTPRLFSPNMSTTLMILVVAWLCFVPATANAQAVDQPTAQSPKAFATPQQAAEELIKAAAAYDVPELTAIFGPEGEDLISSADPIRDKNNATAFAKEASVTHTVKMDPPKPNLATVIGGQEQWPLAVPLVKKKGKWYFDAKSGRQQILFRRIGANEPARG
jgi:hypothetical protein